MCSCSVCSPLSHHVLSPPPRRPAPLVAGSGIYYTINSTIVAQNKLAVLSDLGISWDAMAAAVFAPNNKFFPGQANQGNVADTVDVRSFMSPSAAAFTNAQLLEIGAFGTYENLPTGFNKDDLYMVS